MLLGNDSREEKLMVSDCIYSEICQTDFEVLWINKKVYEIFFYYLYIALFYFRSLSILIKFDSGPRTAELLRKVQLQNQWCLNQHFNWYCCFCLVFGEALSKVHRNQSRSFCSVQFKAFWIRSIVKLSKQGQKQLTGGNGAVENVWCSPQNTNSVPVCKRISVES